MQRRTIGFTAGLLSAAAAITLFAGVASQAAPAKPASLIGERVANFMLPDQTGLGYELFYYKTAPAVVIVSSALGDPTSARAATALADLQSKYAGKGVQFMMLDSSLKDSRDAQIDQDAKLAVPVLADELQVIGRSLGVTRTAEVFVVDPKTWTVAYHGPIDASFAVKKNSKANLADALDAMVAGNPVAVAEAPVNGAAVAFPDRDRTAQFAKISYTNDIAPILKAKCVSCHTTGGIGPFAMSSYETVKGFSPMIREVLRTKRMPPYHADTHWGQWSNDMRLTDDQTKTLINWIEAGSPRGAGDDPLPAAMVVPADWPAGKPDLIVTIPKFDVPASGVIDYQERSVPTGLTEGKWVRETAWKTGARQAVHHILAGYIPEVRADGRGFSWNVSLGGYGPGGDDNMTPANTGIYLPPGGSFAYQMHYTPIGKPVTDETQVGYYFYKQDPKYILRQASVTDFSIEIPAGESRHREQAYLEFPHDAILFGTQPHAHYRAYSTKLTIQYPDGHKKVLLNQPRYDFAWQREYIFKGGFEVPAGSKLIAEYVYDNSAGNPSNPDPKKDVTFGEQTFEEMLFTFVRFTWKGETIDNRHDDWQAELNNGVMFGALDDNMDGKLQLAEFRNSPRFAPFKQYFSLIDANHDGGIDKAELATAMAMMKKMQAGKAAAPAASAGAPAETAPGKVGGTK
ncbi:MAG: redoxin domain-containing protein [Alphaproteobacteria bacterium]|nr:redoxin domain-containing protein [Alphaproteobacteria bacterium]